MTIPGYTKPYYERCVRLGEPRGDEWIARNDVWITAIHEAAHAVVAYQNGLTVEEVRLRRDRVRESKGHVLLHESQTDFVYNKQRIAMLMAGNIAENIETRATVWYRAGRDEKKALTLIFELLSDGDEDFDYLEKARQDWVALTYRDECFRMTICEVTRPETWRIIRSLARTIYKCRVLRLSQLRGILYRLTQLSGPVARITPRQPRAARVPTRPHSQRRWRVLKTKSFHDHLRAKGRTVGRTVRVDGDGLSVLFRS
jgi:hypothetical protein